MNTPLRRVAVACLVLFGILLVNANYLQVVRADSLKNDPRNVRVLIQQYERARGDIVAGGRAVATSVPTNDQLKYLRTYPGGPTYAHVTGYYSLVYGAAAMEKARDNVLSGDDPRLFVRRLSDLVTGRTPAGGDVVLTLNPAAQEAAQSGLGSQRGAVVALDPRTGAVLALASSPSYDPGVLSSHDPQQIREAWNRLLADPAQPLLNRATDARYPPGSTFKLVTSAAALSSGRYTPDTQIPAPNVLDLPLTTATLSNFGGETCSNTGEQSLADALRISCNTAFGALGLALGPDALRQQALAFGFGREDLAIPLATAASFFPPSPNPPQTAQSAIGQFDVAMTPLQGAMIAAGIANNGVVMTPYLVDRVRAPDLSVISETQPEQLSRAVSPAVARSLTAMMVGVVQDGTGTAGAIDGVTVAGKTGTAQHGPGAPPHAWFVAFAPAEDPVVAVAVLVEDGGSLGSEATGGAVAAPIAKSVMQAILAGRPATGGTP